jgi:hypothetical protein
VAVTGGIYTLQATPAPVLNLTPSDGGLILSWIVPSLGFRLQENPDLRTANWSDVTNIPTLNVTNLHYQVTLTATNDVRLFRLKR